jgi:hypothetical protein
MSVAGGVVDVVCEVMLYDSGTAITVPASGISGGSAGTFAYAPLDTIVGGTVIPLGVGYFT